MKKLTVLMLFSLSLSVFAEEGLKGKLRPHLEKLLGSDLTEKMLGAEPVEAPVTTVKMPEIPKLERKNTDASVYGMDSDLRKQGKDFEALSKEKRRAYEIAFIKELFQATRRAPAKEEDLARWINVLEGGGSREGVYRGLVLDDVYASLESYDEPLSEKIVPWTIGFAKKYFALSYKDEVLRKANLFFLKRIISEKMLEIMDALESRPDDFRSWYALMSADLAGDFAPLFKEGIRLNTTPEVHYKWAQKAHLQHMKSEAIIKLHLVMNFLQDAQ